MRIEAFIGFADQLSIKPLLTSSRFVTGNQQDRPAPWIESECYPPHAVGRIETKFAFCARSSKSSPPPLLRNAPASFLLEATLSSFGLANRSFS